MSIYNGFGTRQLEASYNKALYNTIFLLQLRIYKLFKGGKSWPFQSFLRATFR